jgi:hypothetical protein
LAIHPTEQAQAVYPSPAAYFGMIKHSVGGKCLPDNFSVHIFF